MNGARTLTANVSSHCSRVVSSTSARKPMPASFTTMSMPPRPCDRVPDCLAGRGPSARSTAMGSTPGLPGLGRQSPRAVASLSRAAVRQPARISFSTRRTTDPRRPLPSPGRSCRRSPTRPRPTSFAHHQLLLRVVATTARRPDESTDARCERVRRSHTSLAVQRLDVRETWRGTIESSIPTARLRRTQQSAQSGRQPSR